MRNKYKSGLGRFISRVEHKDEEVVPKRKFSLPRTIYDDDTFIELLRGEYTSDALVNSFDWRSTAGVERGIWANVHETNDFYPVIRILENWREQLEL